MQKNLRGSQIGKDKDYSEEFGANEIRGNAEAEGRNMDQRQMIQERIKRMSKRGNAEPEAAGARRGTRARKHSNQQ